MQLVRSQTFEDVCLLLLNNNNNVIEESGLSYECLIGGIRVQATQRNNESSVNTCNVENNQY